MRYWLLGLMLLVACSGQMCTTTTTPTDTGEQNVCSRSYYDATYRVGLTPPDGSGEAQDGGALDGVALNKQWTSNETSPATVFALVVLDPTQETTLAEFREVWLNELEMTDGVSVLNEEYKLFDNSEQGWWYSMTSTSTPGQVSEFMLTTVFGRLAYVGVSYPDTATDEQKQAITNVLMSLCTDAP